MQKPERDLQIDLLRGITIAVMILIHTNAYFLHNLLAFTLWDISEFAVPAFIFCSAYVFFLKFQGPTQLPGLSYLWKRIKRLLLPYYLFLIPYFILIYFGEPKRITTKFVIQNIFAIGGIDLNWLVLLFIQLSLVMVLLRYLEAKHKTLFFFYFFIAFVSLLFLVFFRFPLNYRYIMWLPWSTVVIFAWIFIKNQGQKRFLPLAAFCSFLVYFVTRLILASRNASVIQFNNKYPPNLYHISFGILIITLLYMTFQIRLFSSRTFTRPVYFLSKYSYEVFFIHALVIYIFIKFIGLSHFTWPTLFIVVFFITIICQLLLNLIKKITRFD